MDADGNICLVDRLTSDDIGYEFEEDAIKYRILSTSPQTVQVAKNAGGSGYKGNIVIPRTIKIEDKTYNVVDIENLNNGMYSGAFCQTEITSLSIPGTVKSVSPYICMDCIKMTSLLLSEGIEEIGKGSFYCCTSLPEISLPNSLKKIDDYAFGHNSFNTNSTLTRITIPDKVESIGSNAFCRNTALTELVLGKEVQTIGGNTFNNCNSLTSIVCRNPNPPTITSTTFTSSQRRNATLLVPMGSLEAYQSAEYWKDFGYISEQLPPYVTFTTDGVQTFTLSSAVETWEYSVNNSEWEELGTKTITFGGESGDLRLRGKNSNGAGHYATSNPVRVKFSTNALVYGSGDLRTLVDYENHETTDCSSACFQRFFEDCTVLVSGPDMLNDKQRSSYCFYRMFKGCTNLISAPDMCWTKGSVSTAVFSGMFYECTSLINAPEVIAPESFNGYHASSWCSSMFYGCTSLKVAPNLPVKESADGAYFSMFEGCTSLEKAPDILPTTNIYYGESMYNSMFRGCTSLKEPPAFPDEYIDLSYRWNTCFQGMFAGCTNLGYSPIIKLKTPRYRCMDNMFKDCSSLTRITYYSDKLADCYNWVEGVAPTGIFVTNLSELNYGPSGVPVNWVVDDGSMRDNDSSDGHEYVDLGTVVNGTTIYWAKTNIGAENVWDYGDYFAWGETVPKYTESPTPSNPSVSWKEGITNYDWKFYQWCNGDRNNLTKYNYDSEYGSTDTKTVLDLEDDAAHANWGGVWRMPTRQELQSLYSECHWEWVTSYDGHEVCGIVIYKAKRESDKQKHTSSPLETYSIENDVHIFIPFAGYIASKSYEMGDRGFYWSSNLSDQQPDGAYRFDIYNNRYRYDWDVTYNRHLGFSVRPVCQSAK